MTQSCTSITFVACLLRLRRTIYAYGQATLSRNCTLSLSETSCCLTAFSPFKKHTHIFQTIVASNAERRFSAAENVLTPKNDRYLKKMSSIFEIATSVFVFQKKSVEQRFFLLAQNKNSLQLAQKRGQNSRASYHEGQPRTFSFNLWFLVLFPLIKVDILLTQTLESFSRRACALHYACAS